MTAIFDPRAKTWHEVSTEFPRPNSIKKWIDFLDNTYDRKIGYHPTRNQIIENLMKSMKDTNAQV